ncbi:MAG: hypothetical protein ACI85F_002158 [Bacteroidia bacterium]|jgi:hypothetical protein
MIDSEQRKIINKIQRQMRLFVWALVVMLSGVVFLIFSRTMHPEWSQPKVEVAEVKPSEELPEFENGIHLATGFAEGENLQLVIGNCTSCHSAKMVTQNRASREGWKSMIVWMQETQGLWNLGDNEPLILDYLAKHYAPKKQGRRAPLTDIAWYDLED